MISICVVTYESLDYLKILYNSVKRNTKIKYEFVVHDNASTDGTQDWLKENGIIHTVGKTNEGNCALNYAVDLAKYDHVFVPNADMYLLPNWDIELVKNINYFKSKNIENFMISHRLVEPMGNNPEYVIEYCGHTPETFDEKKLLDFYAKGLSAHVRHDTIQYSFPNCMPKKTWLEAGGMDLQYFPGWSADVDLAVNLYKIGCRNFKLLANPKVYHFVSGTNRRLSKEVNSRNGWDIFQRKWNMGIEEFRRRMGVTNPFQEVPEGVLT